MGKLKYAVIVIICCLLSAPLYAQKAVLFEMISVPGGTSTPTLGTSTMQAAAMDAYGYWKAVYTVEGGPVRVRFDAGTTTVTTSSGHKLVDGDILVLDSLSDIRNFRTVQTGSVSTQLHVTYERSVTK